MPRVLLSILVLVLAQQATAAQPAAKKTAPVAKIVVVQPQADQQLTGCAEVRIKVEVPDGATAPTACTPKPGKHYYFDPGRWQPDLVRPGLGDGGRMTTCFDFPFLEGVTT